MLRWLKYELLGDRHSQKYYRDLKKLEKEMYSYQKRVNIAKLQIKKLQSSSNKESQNNIIHRVHELNHGIEIYEKYITNMKNAISSMSENYRLQRKLQHKPTSRWLLRKNYIAQKELQDSIVALQKK